METVPDKSSLLTDLIYAIVVLVAVLFAIWRKRSAVTMQDGPILSSEGMLGADGLTSMAQGTLVGFSYNLLTNETGRVMFFIELGHNSWSHIIAYGDKSNMSDMTASFISKKWLESASLEGDFPDYFHMYCNPEAQDTLREVFTPDIMGQFVDFCRSYDFELFHDSLYISLTQGAHDTGDQTTLTTDITNFLQKNADVLSRL